MAGDVDDFKSRIGGEVDLLLGHFFSTEHHVLRANLNRDPEIAVQQAVADLGMEWNDALTRFFTIALVELRRFPTDQALEQRRSSEERVAAAIEGMRRALALMTYMHTAMFFMGVLLIAAGTIAALRGQVLTGLTIGGVGFADAVFFMIREPMRGIRTGIASYARIRTAYDTYLTQLDQINHFYITDFNVVSEKAHLIDGAAIEALESIQGVEADLEGTDVTRGRGSRR
jgi:hypothetical protein